MTTEIGDKLQILRALDKNPEYIDILREALEVEKAGVEYHENYKREQEARGYSYEGKYLGWEWHDVHTPAQTLNKMVTQRILDVSYSSRSGTHYLVRNPILIVEAIEKLSEEPQIREYTPETELYPKDLFDIIVAHDKIKWVFKASLQSEKPVHVLLVGPPATAKTLFLSELSRLPNSRYVLGSSSSRAGIIDFLLELKPRYLILDELEKADGRDLSALLSLMQTGLVTRLKKGMREQVTMITSVFAGANHVGSLPQELKSRFIVLKLKEYTDTEFRQICHALLERDNIETTLGDYIIDAIMPYTRDVRDCVKIAGIAKDRRDVSQLIDLIWKHK